MDQQQGEHTERRDDVKDDVRIGSPVRWYDRDHLWLWWHRRRGHKTTSWSASPGERPYWTCACGSLRYPRPVVPVAFHANDPMPAGSAEEGDALAELLRPIVGHIADNVAGQIRVEGWVSPMEANRLRHALHAQQMVMVDLGSVLDPTITASLTAGDTTDLSRAVVEMRAVRALIGIDAAPAISVENGTPTAAEKALAEPETTLAVRPNERRGHLNYLRRRRVDRISTDTIASTEPRGPDFNAATEGPQVNADHREQLIQWFHRTPLRPCVHLLRGVPPCVRWADALIESGFLVESGVS